MSDASRFVVYVILTILSIIICLKREKLFLLYFLIGTKFNLCQILELANKRFPQNSKEPHNKYNKVTPLKGVSDCCSSARLMVSSEESVCSSKSAKKSISIKKLFFCTKCQKFSVNTDQELQYYIFSLDPEFWLALMLVLPIFFAIFIFT